MKKAILIIALVCTAVLSAFGQNPNEIFPLALSPLTYTEPTGNNSVGSVLGTIAEAAAGQTSNNRHPEVVPNVEAVVRTALSDVRRLAPVDGDANANYVLSGDVVNITTWTKSKTTESKDSKGKVVKTVHTDYYASVAVSLTLKDVASGQIWTQKFTGGVVIIITSLKLPPLRAPSRACTERL